MQVNFKLMLVFAFTYFVIAVKSIHSNESDNIYLKEFAKYQMDFDKHYENKNDEELAFNNFANNIVKINDLNAKLANNTNNTKLYVFNKYTDEDPEEFDEHYGFKLMPYDEVHGKESLRSEGPENNKNNIKSIKDVQLYDLQNVDQLYEQYLKQFNKTKPKNQRISTIRYYRFVKTLVEINKNNMDGKALRTLDDQADKVQKPHEYFY